MNKELKIQNLIKKWMPILNLKGWIIGFRFVDFKRTDYQQSGDIEVDLKNKKTTILISNNPTKDIEHIIVHELVHLLLWEYDHFCEEAVAKNKKDQYFDLLEEVVAKFTDILIKKEN